MPKCKNYKGYFTGKEPSPRGLGYHAQGEPVGSQKIGRDGDTWQVIVFRHGQRWQKIQSKTKIQDPLTWVTTQQIYTTCIPRMNHTMYEFMEFMDQLEFGMLCNQKTPYSIHAWNYFVPIVTNIQIKEPDFLIQFEVIPNQMGIPYKPQKLHEFIQKWIHIWTQRTQYLIELNN